MAAARAANLGLRFALELCALAAFGWWGYDAGGAGRWLLAIGAPLVMIALWSRFAAPASPHRLRDTPYHLFQACVFGLAAAALVAVDELALGVALAVLAAANAVLLEVRPR